MSERRYAISKIQFPYYGLAGAFSGVPVVRVEMASPKEISKNSLTAHGVVDQIRRLITDQRASYGFASPRWIAFTGQTDNHADGNLFILVRTLLQVLQYVETNGQRSMWDDPRYYDNPKLPMWDHVCVVPSPKVYETGVIKAELFHSVLVNRPVDNDALKTLTRALDARNYDGDKFILVDHEHDIATLLAIAQHPGWKLTSAVLSIAVSNQLVGTIEF